ncbi:hypothetical protein [Kineothrix sedimenti]|uniref:Uncharacterized protein n=1 Tax=Kineothrix sedimenti TaxID=3123317 RepID=A0ABZ3F279_9FIRM
MPKGKFELSKKHQKLIDISVSIPTIRDMQRGSYHLGVPIAHRENAEESLLCALEIISKGTQLEDTCAEIIDRAREIFEYYETQ